MSVIVMHITEEGSESLIRHCFALCLIRFTNYPFGFTIPRMADIEARYNKALDYLYSFVDYSLKHSSELAKADFNLDRMFALMGELGDPQKKYSIIHRFSAEKINAGIVFRLRER